MEIRNKTLYDKELIIGYNKFYLSSYIKRNFIIITAISTVFIVYMLIQQEWAYAAILFGILGFYLVLTAFMQKLTTKRILKRSPLVEQPVLQTYVFRETDFDVQNIKSYNVKYTDIVRYRKSNRFYLLQSIDRKTYIVDFNGFDSEKNHHEFTRFMEEMFAKKRRK